MLARRVGRLGLLSLALLAGACGTRSALERPDSGDDAGRDGGLEDAGPDAFVPAVDAGDDPCDAPDAPLEAIVFEITLGADSLGDTTVFRPDVSAAFVYATFADGRRAEVSFNEGRTYAAYSTHLRAVPTGAGLVTSDLRSVGIRHEAAGDDVNADNWTMTEARITSRCPGGAEVERVHERGAPLWTFRKNADQVWERAL